MTLSDAEKILVREAVATVHTLNQCLQSLRISGFAANIKEHNGQWLLDAKAIIKSEHWK